MPHVPGEGGAMHKSGAPGRIVLPREFVRPGLTAERVRGASSEAAFKEGSALHARGRVTSARMDGGSLTGSVKDEKSHRVRVGARGGVSCACGARSEGACAHAVAVLLYAADNMEALLSAKRSRDMVGEIIRRTSRADLQKFLMSEIKKSPDVRRRFLVRFGGDDAATRTDYRREVDVMFAGVDHMTSWNDRLRFTDFFRAAKAHERRGRAAEAVRICREVSEGIEANYGRVDDSGGHYSEEFCRAVREMAACVGRGGMERGERRRHISYLHRRFLNDSSEVSEGAYYQASIDACADAKDLEYLAELNGQLLPEGRVTGNSEYGVLLSIYLQAEVLENLGRWEAAGGLLEKHYRTNIDACREYVELLLRHDTARARSVLEEARGIFSDRRYEDEYGYVSRLADRIK